MGMLVVVGIGRTGRLRQICVISNMVAWRYLFVLTITVVVLISDISNVLAMLSCYACIPTFIISPTVVSSSSLLLSCIIF